MPRKRLPGPDLPSGVRVVKAKGKPYYYYQSGRGTDKAGPTIPLGTDPFSPEFAKKLAAARGDAKVTGTSQDPKSVSALIAGYKASPEFAALSDSTKKSYTHYLKHMENVWGRIRADQVSPAGVLAYRDQQSPRSAKIILSVGRELFRWGIPRNYLTINPFTAIRAVKVEDKGHWPWPAWAVDYVLRHGPEDIARYVELAIETGQRERDVLLMGEAQLDKSGIWSRPTKTKRIYPRIYIPLSEEATLEVYWYSAYGLNLVKGRWNKAVHVKTKDYFIVSPTGKRYTPEGFRSRWNRWLRTTEGKELVKRWAEYVRHRREIFGDDVDPEELARPTLHGLRSTAVVKRRMAGYQPQQISNDIGMSVGMVMGYSRFMDQREAAENNIILLNEHQERRRKSGKKAVDSAVGNN